MRTTVLGARWITGLYSATMNTSKLGSTRRQTMIETIAKILMFGGAMAMINGILLFIVEAAW